jgi:catechol 2,3-dioxygenase-like lactoylglutathione lyase family enzyme
MRLTWLLACGILTTAFVTIHGMSDRKAAESRLPPVSATGAFAAFVVTDLDASIRWYESVLGLKEIKRGRSPHVAADTVILAGDHLFIELAHFRDRRLARRRISDFAPTAGPMKTGAILASPDFDALVTRLTQDGRQPGVFEDTQMHARSLIVRDNDDNILQFFSLLEAK